MDFDWFIGLGIAIGIAIGIAYWVFSHKCPKCKRFFAMKKAGTGREFMYAVKCRYCGHREWKRKSSGGGGFGGGNGGGGNGGGGDGGG